MAEQLGSLTFARGETGAWVLQPTAVSDRFDEELDRLDAVTTIGELRAFLAELPLIADYAGGPEGDLESIDEMREACDPGQWKDEGLADDSPWSSDRLRADTDYPWPPMPETLSRELLDEELVEELLRLGLAEYKEVGGPMDWLTIPDHHLAAAVACAERLGYAVAVHGR